MKDYLQWLSLSELPDVGVVTLRRLLEIFQTPDAIFSASPKELREAGLTPKKIHACKHPDFKSAEKNLHWVEKNNCQLISWADSHYPPLLREVYDAPILLYVQGNVDLLQQRQLAIVGSRNPSRRGIEIAEQFARELSRANLVITSGLALGIDAASHRGALLETGKTIAVLGTGLSHIYPEANRKLAEDILLNGALLSEFSPNTPPKAAHFPMRNRIISGLSLGVLVVEAALKSGSLITARLAVEQNREVFAIPGSIHNPLARGCHKLLREGAKLVETTADILEELKLFHPPSAEKAPAGLLQEPVDLDPELKRVLAQIGYEVTALDVIIARTLLTAAEVSSMLLSLELKSYIKSVPGGYAREGVIPV
ncbi:MAG: hypothetical protein ACD_60C00105G0015 [uncultured bacterium]|nr:MAG: hypothetical protein ACD_60C00105G0015 [uncultured bacterium]